MKSGSWLVKLGGRSLKGVGDSQKHRAEIIFKCNLLPRDIWWCPEKFLATTGRGYWPGTVLNILQCAWQILITKN